ncbi:hypothetical protein EZS27_008040 [termite gut metagenome]|uniref:Uncharacterized protein n=1 Tax=termite gut metagenome TaxID=433724 RepID=A0A5J4SDS3_9ZZZZ
MTVDNKDFCIISECYIDTNLIETLLSIKRCNHQKGCNNVVKIMKGKLKDDFALGIVDNDKEKIKYVEEFEKICQTDSLCLYKHSNKPHYLIVISPVVDAFILKSSLKAGVCPEDFKLSPDLDDFIRQTKQVTSKEDIRFKQLFKKIKDAPEMKILKEWVNYLKTKQYYSNPDELIALMP